MYCPICNGEVEANAPFCPHCGVPFTQEPQQVQYQTPQGAYQQDPYQAQYQQNSYQAQYQQEPPQYQPPQQEAPQPPAPPAPQFQQPAPPMGADAVVPPEMDSYFDGGLLQLIGWTLRGFLISVLTLFICTPWAFCMIYNWEVKHTVINGRRLTFDGHAGQLLGKWIIWGLLTIVTVGIYGLWVPIKLQKWKTKHTHFEDGLPGYASAPMGGFMGGSAPMGGFQNNNAPMGGAPMGGFQDNNAPMGGNAPMGY